jgi:hypothetical protein
MYTHHLGHPMYTRHLGHPMYTRHLGHPMYTRHLGHTMYTRHLGQSMYTRHLGHSMYTRHLGHSMYTRATFHTMTFAFLFFCIASFRIASLCVRSSIMADFRAVFEVPAGRGGAARNIAEEGYDSDGNMIDLREQKVRRCSTPNERSYIRWILTTPRISVGS